MYIRPGNSGSSADNDQQKSAENSSEITSTGAIGADLVILAQADTGSSDGFVIEPAKEGEFDAAKVTQTFTATEGSTVTLPTGTVIDRILISGEDLLIIATDGSVYLIENGALNVPTLAIDGVTIPSNALAKAVGSVPETQPAAGPESGSGQQGSSGNSFTTPEGTIAEGFETVDLLGFTQFDSETSETEERDLLLEEEDTAPIFLGADSVTVEEDDLNQGLGIKYHYLSKNYAKQFWQQIEDNDQDGNSVGNNEDGSIDAFTATGNLNINFQDDGPAASNPIVFTGGQTAPLGLTSDGQQLTYDISPDGLTMTASDEDGVVFTVVIDPTVPGGQYTFTLTDNIDHLPTELGEELLNLGFSVTATDGDGSVTVGDFSVNIQDDVPVLLTKEMLQEDYENGSSGQDDPRIRSDYESDGENGEYSDQEGGERQSHDPVMLRMGMVDEDDLNNFDPDHNSDGDNVEGSHGTDGQSEGAVKAFGSLGVLFGADDGEARSIVFNLGSDAGSTPETDAVSTDEREDGPQGEPGSGNQLTACVKDQYGNDVEIPLTSKGEAVEYVLSEDGTTLLAFAGGVPDDPFGEDGGENQKYSGHGDSGAPRLVFKVMLDDDDYGYFKFTLFDQLDHPKTDNPDTEGTETSFEDTLVLKFGFTATDSDGDSIDSELTIKVKDDVPELNCPPKEHDYESWEVVGENLIVNGSFEHFQGELNQNDGKWGKFDDSDVPGWTLGESGNPIEIQKDVYNNNSDGKHELELDSDGNSTVYQEVPTHDCGSFKLSFDYSARPGSDAETNPVEVWWNGELLTTITADGTNLEGFDWNTYTFLVEGNGDTGLLEFKGAGDSDSFGGMIDSVSLYEVKNPYQVQGHVDEDDLYTYLSHGTSPDSDTNTHYGLHFGTVATSGTLTSLVKVGADEVSQDGHHGKHKKGEFNFQDDAVETMQHADLESKGHELSFEVDGNFLIGYVNSHPDYPGYNEHSDRTVFTLEVKENGDFEYIQFDQLDHEDGHGRPIDTLKIDFSKVVNFSDFDGDTIPLDHGSFVIKVGDDRPELTSENIHKSVDEDDIRTSLSEGTYSHNDHGPLNAGGDLAKLVVVGADENPKFEFKSYAEQIVAQLGLTSKGGELSYEVDGDTLIGYVNSNAQYPGYNSSYDRKVFSLKVEHDGNFEYKQFDQLDHKDSHGRPVDILKIDFSKIVEVTDFDGDTIGLRDGSFVIKVVDDQPYVSEHQDKIVVDEDGLPDGNPYGPGDQPVEAPQNEDSGNLKFKVGADEPADVDFAGMHHDSVVDKHGNDITSDGASLKYVWNQGTHTLSAVTADAHKTPVFTMTITDVATGAYVFKLVGPVDHPNAHLEDDINLKLDFNVTDYDLDTASGSVHVLIDDDSPIIKSIDDTEITAPYNEPVMVMGDIDVRYGGDGPGTLKLKDVDFEGYETELSDDGTKLTGTQNGTKIFEVSIDPVAEKYTYKLFETPNGATETTHVTIPKGYHGETEKFEDLTFDGKLHRNGSWADAGHSDNIDGHGNNGFGVGSEYISDQKFHGKTYQEGFSVEVDGDPINSLSFDMDFYKDTPGGHVYWSVKKDGVEVGSGDDWVASTGKGSEVGYDIDPGVEFDDVWIYFDMPNHGDRWVQLNDFEYTRETTPEFEFEVVATDNDGDKTVGDFTVVIEPTKSITLKILQQKHSGEFQGEDVADQHYFDDLVIKVDGVPVSFSLVAGSSQNAELNGDDLLLTGGEFNEDRIAYLQIDNVPLGGIVEVSSIYSNGDGARDSGAADVKQKEGVKFFLDAGDGFKLIGDYRTDADYTGNSNTTTHDTEVERSFSVEYAADGSISNISDPIVLDLNGDGASLLSAADGVSFDIDADGTADQTGWVAPEDGLLVVDVDGSGSIEDGSEVFSENFNGGNFDNSLEALASLDDNGDGVIDANDAAYDDILVWQDANSDGISQAGELQSLGDRGITSIDLGAQAANTDINGNHIFAEGQITLESGEIGTYVGVDLAGTSLPSEGDLRQQRQIAAADAIAAAIGAVAIIDLMTEPADAGTANVSIEPEHGEVSVNADFSVTYEGADGFTGTDSFTVEVIDSAGTVEIKTVHLDVDDGVVTASAVSGPGDTVLQGTDDSDTLEAGGGVAVPDGEATADTVIVGGESDDVLIGGEGDDVLTGGAGDDELHGGGGADTLFGGAGDDALFGDDGEDILIGGAGANELTGGDDADVFVFTKGALEDGLLDQILDYNFADGDTVDLSQLFDVEGGELSDFVEYDAATGELKVDADGAGGGEEAQTIATVDTGSGPAADLHVLFSDDGNTNTDVV